jgi:hypothetical protein
VLPLQKVINCNYIISNYSFISSITGGYFTKGHTTSISRFARIALLVTLLAVLVVSTVAQTNPTTPVTRGAVVYGDDAFKGKMQQALDYLKADYPADYDNVTFWLSEVRPTDTYTRVNTSGICFINGSDADASYYWLAGVLIHEAQHVADDRIYFVDHPYTDRETEQRALTVQASYLRSVSGWTEEQSGSWVDGWLAKEYWATIPAKYGA